MKKTILIFSLLFFSIKIFGQQFSQYNTGTLYDSFENPSQRAFIPDSSKQFAFNFFIPSLSGNFFLSGDAQATLKTRYFLGMYNNSLLNTNGGHNNHVNADVNVYWIMAKLFASLNGDEEVGFSVQTKSEGKGLISDAAIGLLNGTGSFYDLTPYPNAFNGNYYLKTYHQVSFTYREKLSKAFTFGVKLSALLGIEYSNLSVQSSSGMVDYLNQTAQLNLQGQYYAAYIPGSFSKRDILPTFRNPGVAISIGSTYKTEDGYIIQGNVKDLGFIHWSGRSKVYNFNNSGLAQGLETKVREDSVYNTIKAITHHNGTQEGFNTAIDGKAELSISKSFWIDEDNNLKYSPTLIASKEFFYPGFVGALVNPIQHNNFVYTITTTYDDLKTFNLGAQFMYKNPNFEFYIGSDKLTQSIGLMSDAVKTPSASQFNQNPAFTGASFFIGFSLKLGNMIEHPMNASSIPSGEKGFIGRLIGRFFKTTN